MTKIKSVSITEQEDEFMNLHNLSPSGLLKQRIKQIEEFHNEFTKERVENLLTALKKVNKELLETQDKLFKLENPNYKGFPQNDGRNKCLDEVI